MPAACSARDHLARGHPRERLSWLVSEVAVGVLEGTDAVFARVSVLISGSETTSVAYVVVLEQNGLPGLPWVLRSVTPL